MLSKKGRTDEGILSIIPETLALRTWTEKHHDLRIVETGQDFSDEGFPLFRQEQLQILIATTTKDRNGDIFDLTHPLQFLNTLISTFDDMEEDGIKSDYKSQEQLWLGWLMYEHFDKIWIDIDDEWLDRKVYLNGNYIRT